MPACSITSLNIDGSRVAALDGVGNLPELRKISANYNPLGSLGDLNKCQELTHASFIGASCTDFSVFAAGEYPERCVFKLLAERYQAGAGYEFAAQRETV